MHFFTINTLLPQALDSEEQLLIFMHCNGSGLNRSAVYRGKRRGSAVAQLVELATSHPNVMG